MTNSKIHIEKEKTNSLRLNELFTKKMGSYLNKNDDKVNKWIKTVDDLINWANKEGT